MRVVVVLAACGLLAVAGCGDESGTDGAASAPDAEAAAMGGPANEAEKDAEKASSGSERDARMSGASGENQPDGTTITVGDSQFGSMLFGSDDQAIYIFENDPEGKSVCNGECARAWPPVYTDGAPQADRRVKQSLLGTTKRGDGRLQVTYAGQPLYFYANEAPGEVRCHNVDLNGGLWWAVGPDGVRLP